MTTAAVVTLVIGALIVAAAALGLIRVILHLVAVRRSLDALEGGVRVIAERTSTVPTVLPSVNASLQPVRDFCESI
jgi:hypothetical protein